MPSFVYHFTSLECSLESSPLTILPVSCAFLLYHTVPEKGSAHRIRGSWSEVRTFLQNLAIQEILCSMWLLSRKNREKCALSVVLPTWAGGFEISFQWQISSYYHSGPAMYNVSVSHNCVICRWTWFGSHASSVTFHIWRWILKQHIF